MSTSLTRLFSNPFLPGFSPVSCSDAYSCRSPAVHRAKQCLCLLLYLPPSSVSGLHFLNLWSVIRLLFLSSPLCFLFYWGPTPPNKCQHPFMPSVLFFLPFLSLFLDDSINSQLLQYHCDLRLPTLTSNPGNFFEHHGHWQFSANKSVTTLICFFLINSTVSSSCSTQKPKSLLIFPFSVKPFSLASNNCTRVYFLSILTPSPFFVSTASYSWSRPFPPLGCDSTLGMSSSSLLVGLGPIFYPVVISDHLPYIIKDITLKAFRAFHYTYNKSKFTKAECVSA